ncbi:MAG TPA: shikimate kinase [Acidimicrobiales bacterium]|nr:shikimate kinase [Acidimicrobiales bacterium]
MSRPGPAVDRIVLVGMMGAGKTTVGRLLAGRLGWAYADSDDRVQEATGHTVPELFAQHGEAAFRAAESEALRQALRGASPQVVSVAGGAVLAPANRALLRRSGTVVWLRARPETLGARVGDGRGRPLLGDDPSEALTRLDRVRRPLYEQVAHVVVDVDDLQPDSVVDRVLAAVGPGWSADAVARPRTGPGAATGAS